MRQSQVQETSDSLTVGSQVTIIVRAKPVAMKMAVHPPARGASNHHARPPSTSLAAHKFQPVARLSLLTRLAEAPDTQIGRCGRRLGHVPGSEFQQKTPDLSARGVKNSKRRGCLERNYLVSDSPLAAATGSGCAGVVPVTLPLKSSRRGLSSSSLIASTTIVSFPWNSPLSSSSESGSSI
jgi:hypothetical protein